jgi:hypothetical protein
MKDETEIISDLNDIKDRARGIGLMAHTLRDDLIFEKKNTCRIKLPELFTFFDNSIKRLQYFTDDLEFFNKKIQEVNALKELELASKLDFNERLIDIHERLALIAGDLVKAGTADDDIPY